MFEHIFLGMVHNLDGHNQNVGERVEAAQVFGGVITRIIKAWSVEKSQQGSFRSGKLVLSRKARARLEAFANLYKMIIADIRRVESGQKPQGGYPNVYDGLRGMQFIVKAVESSQRGAVWVDMPEDRHRDKATT